MNGLLVHQYLEHTAKLYPQKKAVTDGRTSMTFGELSAESDRLAKILVGLGVTLEHRIVYYLQRSSDCIVATVGILKAGAAYIPLDQKTPLERWHRIVMDAAPVAIICNHITLGETLERVKTLAVCPPIICLSPRDEWSKPLEHKVFFYEDMEDSKNVTLTHEGDLNRVAYVLYTSGSTGIPKGVMITHRNIRNYIDWAVHYFRITQEDRILGTAPFYFDMSTFDIFCFMATGATFCLATESMLLFPEKLVRFIEDEQVTLWKGVSSLLMYMCRAGVLRAGRMPSLRTVIFAGEPLDAKYLAIWMELFPEKSFFNGYGPTEATGVSLCYHVKQIPAPGQMIPIGRACKGAKVVLIGDDGLPVGRGDIGELCIAGDCLAKGYLNDPEKTEKNFTPPPPGCSDLGERMYRTGDLVRQTPEGELVFVSRKDYQVKWMGYRIELGEIETNIMAHPQIRDAAVVLANAGEGGLSELTAFFEAENDVDIASLIQFLGTRIPAYMIPKRFIRIDALPRNDRGKISREEILDLYSVKNG
ncbi:MAG TPA: amino acid adenylation domain-containing protein [Anaerolineales bacterium]|nr:amino acid adenylation domain-containing protein [Anaerolineales bacterium]